MLVFLLIILSCRTILFALVISSWYLESNTFTGFIEQFLNSAYSDSSIVFTSDLFCSSHTFGHGLGKTYLIQFYCNY